MLITLIKGNTSLDTTGFVTHAISLLVPEDVSLRTCFRGCVHVDQPVYVPFPDHLPRVWSEAISVLLELALMICRQTSSQLLF